MDRHGHTPKGCPVVQRVPHLFEVNAAGKDLANSDINRYI